jgi:heme/copper-type cytochrome/quinol oxidase subunit 4
VVGAGIALTTRSCQVTRVGVKGKETVLKQSGYGIVIVIGLVLAALTAVELFMALNHVGAGLLMLVAALKAILVIYFFMHVSRLWTAEGEH